MLLFGFGYSLRFAVDVDYGHGPEGNQIDSGDQLGEERWEELPVPAQQMRQQSGYAEVEDVVGGREGAFGEHGEDDQLQGVGQHGDEHGRFELRAGRNDDAVVVHASSYSR